MATWTDSAEYVEPPLQPGVGGDWLYNPPPPFMWVVVAEYRGQPFADPPAPPPAAPNRIGWILREPVFVESHL